MVNEHEHSNIIDGCRQNNRKAQEALYRAYYKTMITICLRYTKNDDDAVEVLNNGFLKVFQHINRYEFTKASLYTWIRTIVVNTCLDFVKKKARAEKHHELNNSVDVHVPADVVSRMKAAELLQLVRGLPPSTGAVFNLYVIEGYSHREIGKLLGISEGTSKWHLSEARKSLQQKIKLQDAT
ncbi:MAG TPA: sigma-70 family RNA polymerase sigma factor [Flavisolibacter sp.]|nr:sigma-70 family RNA polymerase sigma factor [Flavisolibacter sp.]